MTKLTKTECEILLHRLSIADVIAEVADDTEDCPIGGDAAYAAAGTLESLIENSQSLPESPTDAEKWVLVDCIDGSTFAGCVEGEFGENSAKHVAVCRVGNKLAKRISELTGVSVRFPEM